MYIMFISSRFQRQAQWGIGCQRTTSQTQISLISKNQPLTITFYVTLWLHGGVDQWLRRRSLAGGLSLTYAYLWFTGDHFVDEVPATGQQTMQANSAQSLRVGKWVIIHGITWIKGVETIKRQTRAAYGFLVAGQSLWARAWLYARSVCNIKALLQVRLVALYTVLL